MNCNHSVLPGGLKVLGTLLTEASQNSVVCRLGGDEFLLFIPEIQYASISAGLYLSTKGEPFEDCYSKADKALYHVKQNGKQGFFFYQQMELDFSENEVTGKDLELIAHALSESGRYNGDLNLDYRELCIESIEEALECMEHVICKKIRSVDVCTRYSSMQYLLILYEPDETQISKVMDRIFQYYDTLYDKKDFKPSYEYRPIQHSNN